MATLEDLEQRVDRLEKQMKSLIADAASASGVTHKFRRIDAELDEIRKALDELKQKRKARE